MEGGGGGVVYDYIHTLSLNGLIEERGQFFSVFWRVERSVNERTSENFHVKTCMHLYTAVLAGQSDVGMVIIDYCPSFLWVRKNLIRLI